MNHKIEIYSNNDHVQTCEEFAALLDAVAARLRNEGNTPIWQMRSADYTSVVAVSPKEGANDRSLILGTWRIPKDPILD